MNGQYEQEPPVVTWHLDYNSLRLIKKAVDKYYEIWPGGDPREQERLNYLRLAMNAMILERLYEGDD